MKIKFFKKLIEQFNKHFENSNKKSFIIKLKKNKIDLSQASKEFKDDIDVVLEAVKHNGFELDDASDRLKDNKEIVLEAVKKVGVSLSYSSYRLRDDKDIVLEAVKNNVYMLQWASERLQEDKQLLELLEILDSIDLSIKGSTFLKWYEERMLALKNIREKEFMENSLTKSNKDAKKIKF